MNLVVGATGHLEGEVRPPGDKSISHRALLLSAMADGISTITGLSHGQDVADTRAAIGALGASVRVEGQTTVVDGRGGLLATPRPLWCGNSGTTMRLLAGLVAGTPGIHRLEGDASLSRRPMDRVAIPLQAMGAVVEGEGERVLPPLRITGGQLRGIHYATPVPSAQVKSAILLAGLTAQGRTTVVEATPTRRHTEEMLVEAGAALTVAEDAGTIVITLEPSALRGVDWVVPCDPSQAAFAVVAGLLANSGEVVVHDLYPGAERIGFLDVLERMGGSLLRTEADGRLEVRAYPSALTGTEIHAREIPSLDEVPILAIAALRASGRTRFCGVGELRVKESDRLVATARLVEALGGTATIVGDDLVVEGGPTTASFSFDPDHDHRLAMAAAIGVLSAQAGVTATIAEAECIATSYPSFVRDLSILGVAVADVLEYRSPLEGASDD